MAKDVPDRRLEAWKSFLRAYRLLVDRLEEELLTGRGLPLSWYDVLVQLEAAPERRLSMKHLARSVLLSPSGVTRLIDRMEDAGFVKRWHCPQDRRMWFVLLTDAGARELQDSAPLHLRGIEEHFTRHLTEAEAETLALGLSRMIEALQPSTPIAEPESAGLQPPSS